MRDDGSIARRSVIEYALWMNECGLNQGTSGNISTRHVSTNADDKGSQTLLITPSGMPYEDLSSEDIAALPFDTPLDELDMAWRGTMAPSSEWRFHYDIMRARPDIGAVVHTHSVHATALAMTGRGIPAAHYMVAAFGGNDVRCADYATFGTQDLSDAVLDALDGGRTACLMANHGMIACGETLKKAMWRAVELETLAQQYLLALSIGGPNVLGDDEMERVAEKFKTYGLRSKSD